MSKIDYNLTTQGYSEENILKILQDCGMNSVYIRNSPKFVKMCHDNGIETIYRETDDDPAANPLSHNARDFFYRRILQRPGKDLGSEYSDYISVYNELGFPDSLPYHLTKVIKYANDEQYKLVWGNFETNLDIELFRKNKSFILDLYTNGHIPGIHIYLDNNKEHEEGALLPLYYLLDIGVEPFITEFGYLRDIRDANHGHRGVMDDVQYGEWLEEKIELLEGCKTYIFSLDHWPLNEEGKQSGTGTIDMSKLFPILKVINEPKDNTVYDLLDYICPPNGKAYYLNGLGNENCASVLASDGWIDFRKNKHKEEFYVTDTVIGRGADSSLISKDGVNPTGTFYVQYREENGKLIYGAPWIKRFMSPGEKFHRNVTIQIYNYKGELQAKYGDPSDITFNKYHDFITFPQSQLTVKDVVELQWGGEEVYYYAKGFGLVGWKNLKQNEGSYFAGLALTSQTPFQLAIHRPVVQPPKDANMPIPDRLKLGDPIDGYVKSTKDNVANVRDLPNIPSNLLGYVVKNQLVRYRPTLTEKRDGYRWYALESPYQGWLADVAVLAPEEKDWILNHNVPYVSQLGIDADRSNNDCLIAALLMSIRFWMVNHGTSVPLIPVVDDVYPYSRLNSGAKYLNFDDAKSLAKLFGLETAYIRPMDSGTIVNYLNNWKLPIVLVNYATFNPGVGAFPHFVVVKGYNENEFNIHDPYLGGENFRISSQQLMNSMKNVPDNNYDYQGLVIVTE